MPGKKNGHRHGPGRRLSSTGGTRRDNEAQKMLIKNNGHGNSDFLGVIAISCEESRFLRVLVSSCDRFVCLTGGREVLGRRIRWSTTHDLTFALAFGPI